jgi:glucose-1-phosphate cytidylyltransferase
MKVVILCGGFGTRLAEETTIKPKPMVTIGGKPILWHIMNIYAAQGFKEFVLALGYKSEIIKEYFLNFYALSNDFTVELESGRISYLNNAAKDWKVTLVDTGEKSMTGGRLLRLREHLGDQNSFFVTYGDGVGNVDIIALRDFHFSHGKIATLTAVRPPSRFGNLALSGSSVDEFQEKPQTGEGWINGGFFVFNKEILASIKDDNTVLEAEPLSGLAKQSQLMAYFHQDYWQCMDTIRDKNSLEEAWRSGRAPWRVWN